MKDLYIFIYYLIFIFGGLEILAYIADKRR
ncbi:hypothetical protein ATCC9714_PCS200441 (plasmid) [[Clostridium] sordellii]|uniref:Uncharacterized protein n=1 Tax=Paraclostridium sordellii TaxID=1505 RepID=A0ABP1XVY7_PARSO|nr:hypothetical protein ATCC9714_PCS200441 (plasmid) [[Clostridium] sordellii] [Paeniclostridium sordellii]